MDDAVVIRLLGAFDVRVGAAPVPVLGRSRVVLAVLALSANRPVSVDRLAECVWEDRTPQRVRGSLQTLIARLRAALGADRIETVPNGYRLRVPEGHVDVLRFQEVVAGAATATPAERAALLREALELWRGEPLADVPSEALQRDVVPGLSEERLVALERLVDLDLAAGAHHAVLAELRGLVTAHPLRERSWQQLMIALYRCGRRAEALESYHQVAAVLGDELGLDPGAELQQLHQAVLRDDPTLAPPDTMPDTAVAPTDPVPLPRQLPADPVGFTGRAAALAALDTARTAVIHGSPGVGKTALAVRWAHRVREHFPDGQLYTDLRGYGPEPPRDPADVAESLLRALGVPGETIPADLDGRAALLRSRLADARVLLLLDNARDSEQVRPLLPGGECRVLVTSRRQLRGLAVRDGAHRLALNELSPDEGVALLRETAGATVVDADPPAAAQTVEQCARLPLALRLVAERACHDAHPSFAALVDLLGDEQGRLDQLDAGEDGSTDVRAVLSWSYQSLQPERAEMFRLIGLYPAPEISVPAAAALAGVDAAAAERLLSGLAEVHLLERRLPDLVRHARPAAQLRGGVRARRRDARCAGRGGGAVAGLVPAHGGERQDSDL